VQTTSDSEVRRPVGRFVKAEAAQYMRFMAVRDVKNPAALAPADQANRQRSLEQRSAKHARDMRPALTLVPRHRGSDQLARSA
jgi:hypothetical protein